MRFTLLCPDLLDSPHGGIPTVSRQSLRQIERIAGERGLSLELDVWALHDKQASPEDVARDVGLKRAPSRFRAFSGSRLAMARAAMLERSRSDLVLTTHVGLGPIAHLLPRARKIAQFIHGLEVWRPLPLHQRAGLAVTDQIISNTSFTLSRFHAYNPAYASIPSRVCWLGLPSDRAAVEPRTHAENDALSALIVGRIHPNERYKGHAELIAIWPQVLRVCPGARLDIVGDGPSREDYEAMADRRGLLSSGAVRFLGRLPDAELRELYRQTTVFAMPSRGEGFGLVYLEAMAAGVPCIGSIDDAAREVIVDGQTGLSVRYGDLEGLARALIELFTDAEERARFGRAGRERVLSTFTEEHYGARLFDALFPPAEAQRGPS